MPSGYHRDRKRSWTPAGAEGIVKGVRANSERETRNSPRGIRTKQFPCHPTPESRHFMSSISVIGVGNMAGTLARRALAGGNSVEIIGRDQAKAKELAATLDGATVGTAGTAPAGDIVVLAVPYAGAVAVVREYGDALDGKVIIDISNTFNADATGLVTPEGTSGAQEIA